MSPPDLKNCVDMGREAMTMLVMDYLTVCNRILSESNNCYPYRQIWEAACRQGRPHAHMRVAWKGAAQDFLLSLNQREHFYVMAAPYVAKMDDEGDTVWRVSPDYLRQVVENAAYYMANPAEMNWDWLQNCACRRPA